MRLFFVVVGFCLMVSCGEDEFSTGAQFFDGVSFQLNAWDTLTMNFSTVRFDSTNTAYPDRLVVGAFNHPVYGKVQSSSYLQVIPDSTGYYLDPQEMRYDSITIVLYYDSYYLNDTTRDFTLSIAEVTEDMELNEETSYLFNTSSFETSDEALGTKTFKPRPYSGSSLEITLDDELGQRFYEEAQSSSNVYSSSSDFLDFFKGIKISGDPENKAIIGFTYAPEIRLYYTDISSIPNEQNYLTFTNQNSGELFFNHFDADYTGTVLETLAENDNSLSSSDTDETAYMQSGTGLAIRIDIPYIKKVIEDNPDLYIDNVVLKLKPIKGRYSADEELPSQLQLYYVNGKNESISSYAYTMNLTLDDEFDIDTYYSADITEFFQYQLDLDENNNNALLIVATQDGFGSSAHYVALGDQHNDDYQAQINLNLIQLKDD